jgi:RNA polymerase sigma factor (sigma-70 family)
MLPDYTTAEDIFQDLAAEIGRNRDRYDETRDFAPWAKGIARNLVKRYYKKRKRSRVSFVEDLEYLSNAADEIGDDDSSWESKRRALQVCIGKLSTKNRRLITARYGRNLSGNNLARKFGATEGSLRVTLHRIRESLRDCIRRCSSASEQAALRGA